MASVATTLVVNLSGVMEMEVAINLRQKFCTFIGTATVITILGAVVKLTRSLHFKLLVMSDLLKSHNHPIFEWYTHPTVQHLY